jgi:hypothetical protein
MLFKNIEYLVDENRPASAKTDEPGCSGAGIPAYKDYLCGGFWHGRDKRDIDGGILRHQLTSATAGDSVQ